MLLDARAQLRIHVLDRADPDAHHSGAQIAKVLPGKGIWSERISRMYVGCGSHLGLLLLTALTITLTTHVVYDFGAAARPGVIEFP